MLREVIKYADGTILLYNQDELKAFYLNPDTGQMLYEETVNIDQFKKQLVENLKKSIIKSSISSRIYNLPEMLESIEQKCNLLTIPELLRSTLELGIWAIKGDRDTKYRPHKVYAAYYTNGEWTIRIVPEEKQHVHNKKTYPIDYISTNN